MNERRYRTGMRLVLLVGSLLSVSACSYQPETRAILEQNPSAQAHARDIDPHVRALKAINEAGVSSGYWQCIGDSIRSPIRAKRATGIDPDYHVLEALVREGQAACTNVRPAFVSKLTKSAAKYWLINVMSDTDLDLSVLNI